MMAHKVRVNVPEEIVVIAPSNGIVYERAVVIEFLDNSLEFLAIFGA